MMMRYSDHTRTTTDWACPRARYWGYECEGIGVMPIEPDINLIFGQAIAVAAETIRQSRPLPVYSGPLPWAALYAGLTEAYATRIWPQWLQYSRLVATEAECTIALSPDVIYMARPDAVVERLSDHTFWYIQDKTTSQNPQNFVSGWDKSAELHATALAIQHTLGIEISGAYVQGWCKGYLKNNTLYSPLAYCWLKPQQPGIGKAQPSFEYRTGWPRVPVTELDVQAWVKSLPEPLIQEQFPVTAPIMIRHDLAKTYLAQLLRRELGLKLWRDDCRMSEEERRGKFPQHFNQCDEWSKYKRKCSWHDCCWAPTIARDPVASGLYLRRTPHHEPERVYTQNI